MSLSRAQLSDAKADVTPALYKAELCLCDVNNNAVLCSVVSSRPELPHNCRPTLTTVAILFALHNISILMLT